MALDELMPPIVTVDDQSVSASVVRAEERPGQVPAITVEATAVDPAEPGAALNVVLPGGSPAAFEIGEVHDQDTPAGILWLAVARPPSARLGDESTSVCLREKTRKHLLE